MKKAALILAILVFSILYYMGVMTEKEGLPFSKEFFTVETPSGPDQPVDLRAAWPLKGNSPGQKTTTLSNKELEQFYQLKLVRGAKNLPSLSFLLIHQSEQAGQDGDHDLAVRLAIYATKFSPDLPQGYFQLAAARWRQSPFQLGEILADLLNGIAARGRHFPSSLNFYYNLFYILSNAILLTSMLFGIVVLLKYFPLYVYDIRKDLTQEITKIVLNSMKIFVLFIPFFLRLDLLWAILFWAILLWGYIPQKERQFLLLFFILLVYLPFFLRSSSAFLDSPSADILLEINKANYENWDATTEKKVQFWLGVHPDDADLLFTAGLMEKKQGKYEQAEKLYKSAIQKDPEFSEAYLNLGNVYMARKEIDAAISSYEKAASIDPRKAASQYNLYRAYSQKSLLSEKVDRSLQKARQLDPKLVDAYLGMEGSKENPNINRLVIDESLSSNRFWRRVRDHFTAGEGLLFHLFKAWFEKIPSRVGFLLPVFFLCLVIGMSRYSRAKRFVTRCPMCGSATHRFYLGASAQDFICFNCYRIFVQKEKLHPKIVEKKSLQVQEFQRESSLIGRFISHFILGFGYLWRGNFAVGLLLTWLFFIFVMRFIYWNGVISLSWIQFFQPFWSGIFWIGSFILFYLICLRQSYRLKPKFRTQSKIK